MKQETKKRWESTYVFLKKVSMEQRDIWTAAVVCKELFKPDQTSKFTTKWGKDQLGAAVQ